MEHPIIPLKHIDRGLLFRLSIFLVIALIIFGVVLRDVYEGLLTWQLAVVGIGIGAVIGYILGRILTVSWHETKQKAVLEMDVVGIIAIILYVALRVSENWLFGHWLSGAALSTLSLAVLAGVLLGRFLGLRISVMKLIEEKAQ